MCYYTQIEMFVKWNKSSLNYLKTLVSHHFNYELDIFYYYYATSSYATKGICSSVLQWSDGCRHAQGRSTQTKMKYIFLQLNKK